MRSEEKSFRTAFAGLVERIESGDKLGLDALDALPDAGEHPLALLIEATLEEVLEHAPGKDWAGYQRLIALRDLLTADGDFDALWTQWKLGR